MAGVGLMVRVVGLGSYDPEFKSPSAVELIPGGVDSACHPSEVDKLIASLLVSCVGVTTHPGLYPIAKSTRSHLPRRPWGLQNLRQPAIIRRPQYFHGHTM